MMRWSILIACLAIALMGVAAENEWDNEASLGLNYRSGNTEKSLYILNLKSEKFNTDYDWLNALYAEQGKTEALKTEGLVRFKSEYRLRAADRSQYGSMLFQGVHDAIRGVKLRAQIGPSYGYYFLQSEAMKIDASMGLNATDERTELAHEFYMAYRFASNVDWQFNERASFYFNGELTGNVEEPTDDFQSLLVFGLKSGVTDRIALHAELRNDYESRPEWVGSEKNDLLITVGFTYDF